MASITAKVSFMTQTYTIYGGELSYFTKKLEAAMIFYDADFSIQPKTPDNAAEIEQRSGTHQVPVMLTPENWMIADTTPLLMMLDARFPDRRMFPSGKLGVLTHIIEEYFDEWIARTMVHYRWHYPESAEFASLRMARGNAEAAARVRAWGPRACRATGTDSEHQQQQAEAEYVRILEALEQQLGETPYALGSRPTAVDCIVLGGLRAHTHMDPDPKRITSGYPRVVAWCEEAADTWEGDGELAAFEEPTSFARFVLQEMIGTYQPYALGNKAAQEAGAKAFHVDTYGEEVSYLSRPYPERARQMVVDRIAHTLPDDEHSEVRRWLEETGLTASFGS
ncbi:MAG: glutathione S-transferase family protein [Gammaproteobacteria bacterium]|nr:glutathione S-transferase family protein [Gammaproteobacteria bacterium]